MTESKPSTAIYPGSFDPITVGHLDILERSLQIFDRLVVVVAGSGRKDPLFSPEERAELIREVVDDTQGLKGRITVVQHTGLIMDYCSDHKIPAVVRGLRAASDFEYEFMMASMNKNINQSVETIFMMTSQNLYFVSSTMIKELYRYGGDISRYVHPAVVRRLKEKFGK